MSLEVATMDRMHGAAIDLGAVEKKSGKMCQLHAGRL